MPVAPPPAKSNDAEQPKCLVRSVASALATEPMLEAVTFDRARDAISVATMGKKDNPGVEAEATAAVQAGREASAEHQCGVLTGIGTCETCDIPLGPEESAAITIQTDADKTTIARKTCPTAPRFWHWRDLSLPKFIPKEVELPDGEDHLHEWKWQLLAAGLCAAFGIAGKVLVPGAASLPCYVLAYLAGAWFAAEETWDLLRKRVLDVHFLMV